MTDEGNEDIIL